MKPFIRVIEVWVPDAAGQNLVFEDGLYGTLDTFAAASKRVTFAPGEGLPGRAWATGNPVVLHQFTHENFRRTEAAHQVGLTSAVAIPIFSGPKLLAVLVFLCGDIDQPSGAIEVWQDDGLSGLSMIDGYYGDLERFEWLSKRIKFPRGRGLPGQVWETLSPRIADMRDSNSFLRTEAAKQENINTVIALPVNANDNRDDIGSVVTFLSSRSTPIARRFEIWKADEASGYLIFNGAITQDQEQIESVDETIRIARGYGAIGQSWEKCIPTIGSGNVHAFNAKANDKYESMLAIPVLHQQQMEYVVVLYI